MRRCIIHIGHPKTASTYLQHCFHLNAELFRQANYWVPSDFSHLGTHNLVALSEQGKVISGNLGLLADLMTGGPADQRPAMQDFIFGAPDMPADCDVLLSTEMLFYYRHALAEIIAIARRYGLVVELWGYVQRQDRAAIAAYLQNVRFHSYSNGVIDFLASDTYMPYCRYAQAMYQVRALAPNVPIVLRSFEPEYLVAGDILTDFLAAAAIDVDPGQLRRPAVTSNPGLLLEQYELLRVAAILGWDAAAAHLRETTTTLSANDRARLRNFYYRPGLHRFLAKHYLPENTALLADFMPQATEAECAYWQSLDEPTAPVSIDQALLADLGDMAFSRQTS